MKALPSVMWDTTEVFVTRVTWHGLPCTGAMTMTRCRQFAASFTASREAHVRKSAACNGMQGVWLGAKQQARGMAPLSPSHCLNLCRVGA